MYLFLGSSRVVNHNINLEEASTHTSAKNHTGTVFVCLVTLTFDLLTQKQTGFQESWWNISMSS